MKLENLIHQVKHEYDLKSIAKTRYSALDKITTFLTILENEGDNRSAITFLKGMDKKEFKMKYLNYKIRQLQLSPRLSGAENQAINDLYRNINDTIPAITSPIKTLDMPLSTNSIRTKDEHEEANLQKKMGLQPMVGEAPKVLILGTMPGDESIKKQAYYRNESRNKFWQIIHFIFQDEAACSYEELLKKHHIALWDCLKEGNRKGSSDNGFNAEDLIPNDIEKFLVEHPTIKVIILNGKSKSRKSTVSHQ